MNIRNMTIEDCLAEIDRITEKNPIAWNDQAKLDNLNLRLDALRSRQEITKKLENILDIKPKIHYSCSHKLCNHGN